MNTPTNKLWKKIGSNQKLTLLGKRFNKEQKAGSCEPQKRLKIPERRRISKEIKRLELNLNDLFESKSPSPLEGVKLKKFFLEDEFVDLRNIFETDDETISIAEPYDSHSISSIFSDDDKTETGNLNVSITKRTPFLYCN